MGAWGTAIFADDFAADVRDEWREAILEGVEPDQATERVVQVLGEAFEGYPDEESVFWFALAAAQMETGRLRHRFVIVRWRSSTLALTWNGGRTRIQL